MTRPRRIALGIAAIVAAVAAFAFVRIVPRPGPTPTRAPTTPADKPKPTTRTEPAVWAVVVGIDEYRDQAIPECRGAVADARAVAGWLSKTAGWGDDHVVLLVDDGAAAPSNDATPTRPLAPSRANLDWAVGHWLAGRVAEGDRAVVYFAGQAAGEHLLPADARATDPARTGWPLDEALDTIAARVPVVCWLDTSPRGRGRPVGPEPTPEAGSRLLRRLTRWPGTTAWLAADAAVAGQAGRVGERSPFTGALLAALGPAERARGVLACLGDLRREPALLRQGFRSMGGVGPALDLWAGRVRRAAGSARSLLLQRGHAGPVVDLAFTADGARVITAGADSTLRTWRADDRQLLRSLAYHNGGLTALALSPDGRYLASGDNLGRLRVYDLRDDRERPTGPAHERGVAALGFLPEGARLATLDRDGRAWLWDLDARESPAEPLADGVTGLACATGPGPIGLALAGLDGRLRLFGPEGRPIGDRDGPGGDVTSARLACDGRRVAAGDDDPSGRLILWNMAAESPVRHELGSAIRLVRLLPDRLAVASGSTLELRPLEGDDTTIALEPGGPVDRVAASDDGRRLAACTTAGTLRAWEFDEQGSPRPLAPEGADDASATAVGFAPGGRMLVAGDQDGGLRFWDLPNGTRRARVPARRGQVAGLSVSDDGRYLLQVTFDRTAHVWDLQDGRSLTTIPGRWTAGAIAPDGRTLALIDEASGDVVRLDRETGRRQPGRLARPKTGGVPCTFGTLAFSRNDGKWLAAGSVDGPLEGPVACVWEVATGRLAKAARGHEAPHRLTAVDLTADGRRLLTAGEDGTARVWDLDGDGPDARPIATLRPPGEPTALTAARFDPADMSKLVTGGRDGRVLLWEVGRDAPSHELGGLDGGVMAATFSRDGRWLAATAAADKQIRLWRLDPDPRPAQLSARADGGPTTARPHHDELIRVLLDWPGGDLIASGGDDTAIRLWGLKDRRLRGTLSADEATGDWVAYTPDGLFDSSPGGSAQVSWIVGDEVLPLDQFERHSRAFLLADALRRGQAPEPPQPLGEPPPRLAIDPVAGPVADGPEVALTIRLGEPGLEDVRLYQDGVPLALDDIDGRRAGARVRLRPGVNRFYAMATRPGASAPDGRSEAVEVRYDGPEAAGRLHVLALGVGKYAVAAQSLQFARGDAESFAAFLHRNGVHADPDADAGLVRVLTDRDVSEASVDAAFLDLRRATERRPDDTVVVFLAGHTDVLQNRFHLLLSDFPFPAAKAGIGPLQVDPDTTLPYAAIYRNLARLHALRRVVVVDACQAEAIHDDPTVRRIRELMDGGSRRARTAYFLAARRGEPANEVAALEHGLLTYTLLKGMGATDLEVVPDLTVFDQSPTADLDGNRVITTDELRRFADVSLPRLAAEFPTVVARAGVNGRIEQVRPAANLNQSPRLQGATASFPLVTPPQPPPDVADRE